MSRLSDEDLSYHQADQQVAMAVLLSWLILAIAAVSSSSILPRTTSDDPLASCPGYKASNIQTTPSTLNADLSLAGAACNVYGNDLKSLTLQVVYENGKYIKRSRHHTLIISR